ncbi:MAG: DUF348 domain-containing protein [Ruminococcaceae bacterium]|nr:DUF348 domain-containing protein [Oscillospiraceae bacterium]
MFNKKSKSNKKVVSALVMMSASFLALTVFASGEFKDVRLEVNGNPVYYAYTGSETVGQLLNELKIDIDEDVNSDIDLDKELVNNDVVSIKKTNRVTIIDAGKTFEIYTTASDVGKLIEDGTISINEKLDFMNVTSENKIEDNMVIEITRVTHETVVEETKVPFETVKRDSVSLPKGQVRIISEGSEGILTTTTEITYHNGVEVGRQQSTVQTQAAKDRVIEYGIGDYAYGTKLDTINYSNKLVCHATAYCACSRCCGWSTGITASGMRAQYGVIAVDPRVIPLGTKLYIETTDGSYIYGYSIAADTGGAIKGNRVDLFFPTHGEALQFGRKTVNVYIMA